MFSSLEVDESGVVVSSALTEYTRHIIKGIGCVMLIKVDKGDGETFAVQFSSTADQCLEIANNLFDCAAVLKLDPSISQAD